MAHRLPAAGKLSPETDRFMFHRVVGPPRPALKCGRPSACQVTDPSCGLKKTNYFSKTGGQCSKPEPTPYFCKCCKCKCGPITCIEKSQLQQRSARLTAPPPHHSPGHRLACWPTPNPETCLCPVTCQKMLQQQELLEQQQARQEQKQQKAKKKPKASAKKCPATPQQKQACPCVKSKPAGNDYKMECSCRLVEVPRQQC